MGFRTAANVLIGAIFFANFAQAQNDPACESAPESKACLQAPQAITLGVTFAPGNHLDMQGNAVMDLADPIDPQDAATRAYVDSAVGAAPGGDITAVTPVSGSGITGGGTSGAVEIGTDPTVLQARVTGSCGAGSSIRSIAQNGNVTCETDDAGAGTVTSVASGSGLTGGPIVSAGTLSVADGGISADMLAPNAVTSAKILDGEVTDTDIADRQKEIFVSVADFVDYFPDGYGICDFGTHGAMPVRTCPAGAEVGWAMVLRIPSDRVPGTPMNLMLHWAPSNIADSAHSVYLERYYNLIAVGDNYYSVANGDPLIANVGETNNAYIISPLSPLAGAEIDGKDLLLLNPVRKSGGYPEDTHTGEIKMFGVSVYYTATR